MLGLAGLVVFEPYGEVEPNSQRRDFLRMSRNTFTTEIV